MIRLKKIKTDSDFITCIAYLPNCSEAVVLKFDINNRDFEDLILPKGFEYCKRHIAKAKQFFENCLDNSLNIPNEKDVMWM